MKKLLKLVLVVGLVAVLGIGALVYYLYLNKDELVRRVTERTLAYVLMVDVSIGSASLDIRGETIRFDDIEIGNPQGYNTSHAMKFGTVLVNADVRSFRTDTPTIRLIEVRQPDIIFESRVSTSNLQVLMNNAMRFADEDPPEAAPDEVEKQYKIEKVVIAENTVRLSLPVAGIAASSPTVRLPDIELENLGGDDERVTPAEAFQEIMAVILDRIRNLAGDILPTELLASIAGDLGNLPSQFLGEVEGAIGGISGTATDAARGLTEGAEGAARDAASQADEAARGAVREAEGAVREAEGAIRGIFGRGSRDENNND